MPRSSPSRRGWLRYTRRAVTGVPSTTTCRLRFMETPDGKETELVVGEASEVQPSPPKRLNCFVSTTTLEPSVSTEDGSRGHDELPHVVMSSSPRPFSPAATRTAPPEGLGTSTASAAHTPGELVPQLRTGSGAGPPGTRSGPPHPAMSTPATVVTIQASLIAAD